MDIKFAAITTVADNVVSASLHDTYSAARERAASDVLTATPDGIVSVYECQLLSASIGSGRGDE